MSAVLQGDFAVHGSVGAELDDAAAVWSQFDVAMGERSGNAEQQHGDKVEERCFHVFRRESRLPAEKGLLSGTGNGSVRGLDH
jgi:hypothetical protein